MASIFEQFMHGQQLAQQGNLNRLRLQQMQDLAPLQQQLQALEVERAKAGLQQQAELAPIQKQTAQLGLDSGKLELNQAQAAQVSSLANSALEAFDTNPELAKSIIAGGNARFNLGIKDPESVTKEQLQSFVAQSPQLGKPQLGRFDTKVVGDNLILTDSVTGQQKISTFGKNIEPPEGLNPAQVEQFKSLPIDEQKKIVSKNLVDPQKRIDQLKTIRKGEQLKDRAVKLMDNVLSADELSDVLGNIEGAYDFRLQQSETSIIADIKELENILTGENLDLMTGVLSETDIKIIRGIGAGALNRMREPEEFKLRVKELRDSLINAKVQEGSAESTKKRLKYNPQTGQFE